MVVSSIVGKLSLEFIDLSRLCSLLIPLRHSDDRGPEFSIFVGDLGPEVNEFVLVSLFQGRFASCKSAKIMTDAVTGQSRGYGFVRFSDETDQQRALVEMQGVFCGNRPMRISTATPKTRFVPSSSVAIEQS